MRIRIRTAAVLALLPAGCAWRGYDPYVEDFEKERVFLPGMHVHDAFCRHGPEDSLEQAAALQPAGSSRPRAPGGGFRP